MVVLSRQEFNVGFLTKQSFWMFCPNRFPYGSTYSERLEDVSHRHGLYSQRGTMPRLNWKLKQMLLYWQHICFYTISTSIALQHGTWFETKYYAGQCIQPKAIYNERPFGQVATKLWEREMAWQVQYQKLSILRNIILPIKPKPILERKGCRQLRLFPSSSIVINEGVFLFEIFRRLMLCYWSSCKITT